MNRHATTHSVFIATSAPHIQIVGSDYALLFSTYWKPSFAAIVWHLIKQFIQCRSLAITTKLFTTPHQIATSFSTFISSNPILAIVPIFGFAPNANPVARFTAHHAPRATLLSTRSKTAIFFNAMAAFIRQLSHGGQVWRKSRNCSLFSKIVPKH